MKVDLWAGLMGARWVASRVVMRDEKMAASKDMMWVAPTVVWKVDV